MGYPQEWHGSTDKDDETGEAVFMVEGLEYRLRLANFKDFQNVAEMMEAAFQQGKSFAAKAIRGHLNRAMEAAEREHAL